ncbi:ABC transporter ATP-binding protein [Fusibacter ferrireducens]|uniref:ABC transporter ATP-binding protein n=1 Tax=Fusibacter ferrireducens TaxID=2785058 RepID=A0ABR9ZXV5_9FIRM|nr:ABC transporter ATP-binding protein [Fusibacter ferrireducens]MBF4694983.1 ABC transporter ATP-binding protein [Fusibacter ferrireducens]
MAEKNQRPQRGHRMGGGPMLGAPVQKAKDFKGTLKRLGTYLKPERTRFVLVFLLAIMSTIFTISGPKIMGKATTKLGEAIIGLYSHQIKLMYAIQQNMPQSTIDAIKNQPVPLVDFEYIGKVLLLLIVLYIISALFRFAMSYIMSSVAQSTVYNMRKDVKSKLDRLPLKYYDGHSHGDVLSRITNDMETIATTLQQSLTQLIVSLVSVVGILIMMLTISPVMTLIALLTLPMSMLITVIIAKNSQKYFSKQQKTLGELNGHVEEMYTGHKIVKAFGHEEASVEKFVDINHELYDVAWKAQFMSGIVFPALNFVNNLGYVLVCVVGGLLVAKKKIEIGDIQAFIQYIRQFTQPIVQIANITNIIQSTIASAERVFEVLDEEEEIEDIEDSQDIKDFKGQVEFDHVKFGYVADQTLMEDINIEVEAGHTIAIVGPTGAGKTTLVNLLMRFYELNGGAIRIDGVDISHMKRGDLRQLFGMVLQDTWLFKGTIRDNIAYGRENATEEEIIRAADLAHAHHFIMTLPEGYDTILNEEASNISQGQKQLLTIARAILADPRILILDEATSNVDTRTEVLIQKAMGNLMQGRTSFVIAHRLSTIRDAELILVMNQGTIIEQGNHHELLEKEGFYANLYNSQFSED